jgi:hypothetical protein
MALPSTVSNGLYADWQMPLPLILRATFQFKRPVVNAIGTGCSGVDAQPPGGGFAPGSRLTS